MNEPIEIGGNSYRIGQMDVRKQFHVARRLAPLLPGLGAMKSADKGDLIESVGPIAEILSKMSDEDVNYIIDACLAVCARSQGASAPARVVNNAGQLMFQDITMPQMIQLAVAVIQGNMSGFFPGAA